MVARKYIFLPSVSLCGIPHCSEQRRTALAVLTGEAASGTLSQILTS